MSKRVDFYSISFHNGNGAVNYSIRNFLESIDNNMQTVQTVRRLGDKWFRVFPFNFSHNHRQFVIPFGKLINRNKPYWFNDENHLEEIPAELYDINSLGFDTEHNIMLFTTNREGPSVFNIEEYLNTFIPERIGLFIKVDPVMYNSGIENVRNAELVKSVTLSLDLGRSLNNFYANQIDDNTPNALISAFRELTEVARDDGESKMLSLTLGLGRNGRKEETLNLESLLYLFEHINIGDDFVKEIFVKYKNGRDDKMDIAKLKESNMVLSYPCVCEETQVSPEDLLNNINNAVGDKVLLIGRHNREFFARIQQYNGDEFIIVATWNNNEEV